MPFIRPTIATIYGRIKADIASRTTSSISLPSRSAYDILAKVFAASIHLCYGGLVWLSKQFFADSADEDYLIRIGILNGITRKAATFASGDIYVYYDPADEEINVPAGTIFTSDDTGLQYETTEAGVIPIGSQYVGPAVCLTEGEAGNTTNNLITLDDELDGKPISSFTTLVVSALGFSGGVEQETIEALSSRIILFLQQRPAGGRKVDYENWALEIAGVSRVWVFDNYIGAGTVGVVIADEDFQVVAAGIKDDVQDNINSKGPLGVKKDALDPVPTTVVIEAAIIPNTTEIQTNILNNVEALFDEITAPGATILVSQIRNAYANAGVTDYELTEIVYDGNPIGVVNIEAQNFELPYIDDLTFTTLT